MKVFRRIDKNHSTNMLLKDLVYEVNKALQKKRISLSGFRLNNILLRCIKTMVNRISKYMVKNKVDLKKYTVLSRRDFPVMDLYQFIKVLRDITNHFTILLSTEILAICIRLITVNLNKEALKADKQKGPCLFVPNDAYFEIIKKYYGKMQFSHNNQWIQYLSNKKDKDLLNEALFRYVLPLPDEMPLEGIRNVIVSHNPGLGQADIEVIIEDLGWSSCMKLQP